MKILNKFVLSSYGRRNVSITALFKVLTELDAMVGRNRSSSNPRDEVRHGLHCKDVESDSVINLLLVQLIYS